MTETLRGAGGGRLPLLEVGEARRRAAEVGVPETMAELSVFRTLLHQPRAARAVNGLLHALLWKGTLDARLRELLIMRIGWTTGAVYEWTQHWAVALAAGVPEADVLGVRDWLNYEGFDDADRAVLAATDESLAAGCISDATWAACAFHLDEAQLVELVVAIGNWSMFARLLPSLDVPLEDGVAPWPPDGMDPRASSGGARTDPSTEET